MNTQCNHEDSEIVSDDDRERIGSLPLISEQLPYVFKNGATVGSLSTNCGNCGEEVDEVRGTLEEVNNGMTLALDPGFAVCYKCRSLTPVIVKFMDDGSFLTKTEAGWSKQQYKVALEPWSPSWIVAMLRQKIGI